MFLSAEAGDIANVLARSEGVNISSYGGFIVREKRQRSGRNPKTGVEIPILPRRVLVFQASHILITATIALRQGLIWRTAEVLQKPFDNKTLLGTVWGLLNDSSARPVQVCLIV